MSAQPGPRGGDAGTPPALARWAAFGGTWRVSAATAAEATVELRRCDGGELVETRTLREPREVAWARARLAGDRDGEDA